MSGVPLRVGRPLVGCWLVGLRGMGGGGENRGERAGRADGGGAVPPVVRSPPLCVPLVVVFWWGGWVGGGSGAGPGVDGASKWRRWGHAPTEPPPHPVRKQ